MTTSLVDELRCPSCTEIAWRRVGERVIEDPDSTDRRPVVRHALVNEDGPWDWTCDRCGYRIKPGSHLDHVVNRVQSKRRVGGAILAGLSGLGDRFRTASATTRAGITVAAAVGVVGAITLALVATRTPDRPPPTMLPTVSAPASEALRTMATLVGRDAAALVGRTVELDDVSVESVTGDVTFWLGQSSTERVFVVLDETAQGEAAVRVRAGQRIRLRGTVHATPVEETDLTSRDQEALRDAVVYVRAELVEVIQD